MDQDAECSQRFSLVSNGTVAAPVGMDNNEQVTEWVFRQGFGWVERAVAA